MQPVTINVSSGDGGGRLRMVINTLRFTETIESEDWGRGALGKVRSRRRL